MGYPDMGRVKQASRDIVEYIAVHLKTTEERTATVGTVLAGILIRADAREAELITSDGMKMKVSLYVPGDEDHE